MFSIVASAASYFARCAGVGLGLQSPRWYFSDSHPYWIYDYPSRPYPALGSGVGGCRLIQRPVLGAHGWRTRTVCDCPLYARSERLKRRAAGRSLIATVRPA
jgi:hypothetical protein